MDFVQQKTKLSTYATPNHDAYQLYRSFYMPTDDGPTWAVAFSRRNGIILTAALSIIFTFLFMYLWIFVAALLVWFDGDRRLRRYVALVTIRNSRDPWLVFKDLIHYTYHCVPSGGGSKNWRDFRYGFTVSLVAFLIYASGLTVGVLGPSLLQLGNAAPVRTPNLFYPVTPNISSPTEPQYLQFYGLKMASMFRAISSLTIDRKTLDNAVKLEVEGPTPLPDSDDVNLRVSYNYSLTGVDLGLQYVPELRLTVQGSCVTEYGWYNEALSAALYKNQAEVYTPWNLNLTEHPGTLVSISLDGNRTLASPNAKFIPKPFESESEYIGSKGNSSYAIAIASVHRVSPTESKDPWFLTEKAPTLSQKDPRNPLGQPYWVKPRRPLLDCWEKSTWSYKGKTDLNLADGSLKNATTSTSPEGGPLAEVLFSVINAALTLPMVVNSGFYIGESALASRTTGPPGVLNAAACGIETEMRRLVEAAYVATKNLFTETTMAPPHAGFPNMFTTTSIQPDDDQIMPADAGGFVVISPDVQAFSLTGILILAGILLLMALIQFSAPRLWLRWHRSRHSNLDPLNDSHKGGSSVWIHMMEDLSAAHLFRALYERTPGVSEAYWPCDAKYPLGEDDRVFSLAECKCGREGCMGHIEKFAPPTLGVGDGKRFSTATSGTGGGGYEEEDGEDKDLKDSAGVEVETVQVVVTPDQFADSGAFDFDRTSVRQQQSGRVSNHSNHSSVSTAHGGASSDTLMGNYNDHSAYGRFGGNPYEDEMIGATPYSDGDDGGDLGYTGAAAAAGAAGGTGGGGRSGGYNSGVYVVNLENGGYENTAYNPGVIQGDGYFRGSRAGNGHGVHRDAEGDDDAQAGMIARAF